MVDRRALLESLTTGYSYGIVSEPLRPIAGCCLVGLQVVVGGEKDIIKVMVG